MRNATAEQLALATEAQSPILPAVQDQEPTSLMEVIARASRDPSVDVDKLERLLQMGERVQAREAKTAYYAAMAEMQPELPTIEERGEIKIGSGPGQKYALWEDVNKAIRPILHKHGFAISFRTGIADKQITVTGVLSHRAGHSEETTIHLPSDTSGSKNAVQAVGSSTSYGKRYVTAALLNLTTGDVDDDGRAAGGDGPISEEQFETLQGMVTKYGVNIEAFCKYMKVSAMKEIRAKDFDSAVRAINLKSTQQKKA